MPLIVEDDDDGDFLEDVRMIIVVLGGADVGCWVMAVPLKIVVLDVEWCLLKMVVLLNAKSKHKVFWSFHMYLTAK